MDIPLSRCRRNTRSQWKHAVQDFLDKGSPPKRNTMARQQEVTTLEQEPTVLGQDLVKCVTHCKARLGQTPALPSDGTLTPRAKRLVNIPTKASQISVDQYTQESFKANNKQGKYGMMDKDVMAITCKKLTYIYHGNIPT